MPAFDVVIYSANLPGLVAAKAIVQQRPGTTVCVIDPWGRRGGMVTGGLTYSDWVDERVYWGLTRQFFALIGQQYGMAPGVMDFTFEASKAAAALDVFMNGLSGITYVMEEHIVGATKTGSLGVSITTNQDTYTGKVFIDASYEGDLAHHFGVTTKIGRDHRRWLGEPEAGVNFRHLGEASARPTLTGDGNLRVMAGYRPTQKDGEADNKVQGFNWRLQLTTNPADKLPWPEPPGYDRQLMEWHVGGDTRTITQMLTVQVVGNSGAGTYQSNHNDVDGRLVYGWVDADHPERVRMMEAIYNYYMGTLYYRAAHHTNQAVRDSFAEYTLSAKEFVTDFYQVPGMSACLYVREGRRIIGDYVLDEMDVVNNTVFPDPCFVGGYFMDRHNVQSYPQEDGTGSVYEGHIGYTFRQYYSVPLRCLRPAGGQCDNLLMAWGGSYSSNAWCSVRMEPTLMMAGEVCGMTAAVALDNLMPSRRVSYAQIKPLLDAAGAVTRFVL